MQLLTDKIIFPPHDQAEDDGLLAIGGDLSIERLELAYNTGIFPWYDSEDPLLWWSPDPRMVLFPEELKVSKSMKQVLRKNEFIVTYNKAFPQVIKECAYMKRPDQPGTWIHPEMEIAYNRLHRYGLATSVEVWKDQQLVAGLYGIDLKDKKIFCGESMFTKVSNASKVGFITLVRKLEKQGYRLIDCQMHTNHLESLGAREIDREAFLSYL